MTELQQIQTEIEGLSRKDFSRLRDWIANKDWENWDQQIAKDSASGKLDFLVKEAMLAKKESKLRDL